MVDSISSVQVNTELYRDDLSHASNRYKIVSVTYSGVEYQIAFWDEEYVLVHSDDSKKISVSVFSDNGFEERRSFASRDELEKFLPDSVVTHSAI